MRTATRAMGDETATFTVRDDHDEYTLVEVWDERYYEWDPAGIAGAKVLDLGANIGAFTVWAAVAGAERVRAVEAEPGNYALLVGNAAANTRPGTIIETHNVAAAPGPVSVHRGEIASGSWADAGDGGTPLPNRNLDQLVAGLGDDIILKCDIEGGEYDLFDAADDTTIARVARLVMEYHAPEPGSHRHLTWTPDRFARLTDRLDRTHTWRTNGGDPHRGGLLWAERR